LDSLRSAVLALAADGEATSEQLWAIQEQVAGIAALCSGDFEAKTALHFDGAQPDYRTCLVGIMTPDRISEVVLIHTVTDLCVGVCVQMSCTQAAKTFITHSISDTSFP